MHHNGQEAPISAPTLVTERLTLRAHGISDLDDVAALWGDPEVVRFVGGHPLDREEVWRRLLRHVGHWTLFGYGFWLVHERSTGAFVGELGFAEHHREVAPSFAGAPECGWMLAKRAQGQGFAAEALRAALAWSDAECEGVRTVCLIHPNNAASIGLAGRIGFRQYARGIYKSETRLLFERFRP